MKMDTPKFDGLLEEFSKIMGGAKNKCVLVGSAALATRGYRDVNDLDVIVSGEWFEKLIPSALEVHKEDDRLAIQTPHGIIQISTNFYSFARDSSITVPELRRDADEWNHWRIISIPHFIRFKRALKRQKDLEDLHLLEAHMPEGFPEEKLRVNLGRDDVITRAKEEFEKLGNVLGLRGEQTPKTVTDYAIKMLKEPRE